MWYALTAGSGDRAPPPFPEQLPGAASTAADVKAGQHSAVAVVKEPLRSSVSPLAEPNTPAASVDDPKDAMGPTAPAAARTTEAHAAQSLQAKQQQRRQAVARFKVRLLERAPSPAMPLTVAVRAAQPAAASAAAKAVPAQLTAASPAEAAPFQPDADAAVTIVVPQAVTQRSVPGRQQTGDSLPGSAVGAGEPHAAAKPDAPTANGTHDPAVAALPVALLPAPNAPLSMLLPAPCGALALKGPAASQSNPSTPAKATQSSPVVPQVLLPQRLWLCAPLNSCHHVRSTIA